MSVIDKAKCECKCSWCITEGHCCIGDNGCWIPRNQTQLWQDEINAGTEPRAEANELNLFQLEEED